ncbi:MAG: hypothetical protein QOJ62_2332 [Actinomycetota bacterium]|nr:hypothetical protein [Actinomycetota bacterium]
MPSLLTAVCAALVIVASAGGRAALAVALVVVQAVLVFGWFRAAALTARGEFAGAVVSIAAAAAADVALLRSRDQANVAALAGVLAGLLVLAFVVQLVRRDGRGRLTSALTATVASGAVAVTVSVLLAVRAGPHGSTIVATALVAVAVGVLPIQARVPLWASVPLGLAVGLGAGLLVGQRVAAVGVGAGAAIAAAAVVLGVAARAVARAAAAPDDLTSLAITATLPVAVVAPAVLVVARIMVG